MLPAPQHLTPTHLTSLDPEVIHVSNPLLWVSLTHSLILLTNTHCARHRARPTERNQMTSLSSRSPWLCGEADLSQGCRCVFWKHRRAQGDSTRIPQRKCHLCWVFEDRTGSRREWCSGHKWKQHKSRGAHACVGTRQSPCRRKSESDCLKEVDSDLEGLLGFLLRMLGLVMEAESSPRRILSRD